MSAKPFPSKNIQKNTNSFRKQFNLKSFLLLFLMCLFLSTTGVSAETNTIPDTISVETQTIPAVLLVERTEQTALPGQGVTGKITLNNPLNAFYMSYNIDNHLGGVLDPADLATDVWDTLGLIPPGSELTYNAAFSNTSQTVEVTADLLNSEAIAMTIVVAMLEEIPALAGKSPNEIISAIGDVSEIVLLLDDVITNFQEIIDNPFSWQTPQRLIEIGHGTLDFLTSERGEQIILSTLARLDVTNPSSALAYIQNWVKVYKVSKYAVDAAIYAGISLWSGNHTNRILIVPSTYGAGMPPVTPRLLSPLTLNAPNPPLFHWNPVPRAENYRLQVAISSDFTNPIIDTWLTGTEYQAPNALPDKPTFYWRVYARNAYGNMSEANIASFRITAVDYPPSPVPTSDRATFIADVTLPDGTVVTSGQSLIKTWRVRNIGTSTWASYKLVFQSGNQMGASSSINIPHTAPGQTVDISVPIQAPDRTSTGNWHIISPAGTHVQGGSLWVSLAVADNTNPPPPPSNFTLTCLAATCSATIEPGQSFRPTVRATIGNGQLLQSRGDMLRHKSGDLFGAWPQIAVVGTVNQGASYDFVFYENNPITAPEANGTYQTTWQLWQNGQWVGPELTITFQVQSGGGTNHPPNTPSLTDPGDWAVFSNSNGITLKAQHNGDPDGDSITHYYFEIFNSHDTPNSGWTTSNNWTPPGLGFYGYQWRVKVRDSHGAESGWSDVRHFNINNPAVTITEFYIDTTPLPEWLSGQEGQDKYVICGSATNTTALRFQVNLATDGSDNGEWIEAGTSIGNNCNGPADRPPTWGQLEYESGCHLFRMFARGDGGWENAATRDTTICLANERRPNNPPLQQPVYNSYVPTLAIELAWDESLRANTYHLEVSDQPNYATLLVDQQFSADVTTYDFTLPTDYPTVYWRMTVDGPYGSNQSFGQFHIDLSPPIATIAPLAPITYETQFSVNWSGTDSRSGLRWYTIQVRDGNRPDSVWEDWLVNTTQTAAIFQGQAGHTYYFRINAMDKIGNWDVWSGGDGDTYTVIDPASAPPTAWWDDNYAQKRNLVILNNDTDSIPAEYPMHVHFDNTTNPTAATIYAASLAATKGNDVRVVYNNQTELHRFVTQFTPSVIDIWFPLQASLGGGQTNSSNYQLYYGYGNANNPPSDINTVFLPKTDNNTRGLWHFQEGSGATVGDSSGRGHNGNFTSAAWANNGYLGRTGSFNGTNAYVNMGTHSDFNLTAMTIEGWIYVTDTNYGHIISKWGTGGSSYFVRMTGDRNVQFQINADGGNRSVQSHTLELNRWYHFAAVHDGGTNMWIYIDGVQRGHNGDTRTPRIYNTNFRIGRDPDWGGSEFPGFIQHVRVSNIARHSFPYAKIDIAPSIAVGSPIDPPVTGSAELVFNDLTVYPNLDGGLLVQAIIENQGQRDTQNGFFTDLYVDHLPTGGGDYTGSLQFWVNDPIEAGTVVTLTTVLTDLNTNTGASIANMVAGNETSGTLYAQVDSSDVVGEANASNNIFADGIEVCLANPDAYEGDETQGTASLITLGSTQKHNIDRLDDNDWIKFQAEGGITYILKTFNLDTSADTYMYLYDTDGTTLLTSNDDFDDSLASYIEWTAQKTGTYYVLVRHWNPNVGGCNTSYDFKLAEPGFEVFLPIIIR